MKNKYYTPTLEGLHVGFECEKIDQNLIANELYNEIELKALFDADYKADPNKIFKKHIINHNDIYYYGLNPHLIKNEIRVKHLDREDIESCGVIREKNGAFIKGEYLIHKRNHNHVFICSLYSDEIIYFDGTIKNKSEFKRILLQLGIY